MYILEPVIHETIWGGNRILHNSDGKKIGHLYMVNGHNGLSNIIVNGEDKGKTLRQLFDIKKKDWNMDCFTDFPLTIALVDASDNLSIQVHPDDKTAEKLEGAKIGKKESWIFLSAPYEGWIYAGCNCQTVDEIKQAVESGKTESVVEHLSIKENDYVCVSAGTLHAMTKGSLVYEIEYGSDFTYRFYDYNITDETGKKRELHIQRALQSVRPSLKTNVKTCSIDSDCDEDVYVVQRKDVSAGYKNNTNTVECISVLNGSGKMDGVYIKTGMSILLSPDETLPKNDFSDVVIARLNR